MPRQQAPFLHPAIYPLGLEIALQLEAITPHPQQQPHTTAPQLKEIAAVQAVAHFALC